jgi:hypothetical protein
LGVSVSALGPLAQVLGSAASMGLEHFQTEEADHRSGHHHHHRMHSMRARGELSSTAVEQSSASLDGFLYS